MQGQSESHDHSHANPTGRRYRRQQDTCRTAIFKPEQPPFQRQQPIPQTRTEDADACTGKDVVVPMTVITHSHQPHPSCNNICSRCGNSAIFNPNQLCTQKGPGCMP